MANLLQKNDFPIGHFTLPLLNADGSLKGTSGFFLRLFGSAKFTATLNLVSHVRLP